MGETAPRTKITIVALFYHAPGFVAGLVEAVLRQKHPDHERQEDWLEVILMDNGSTDETGRHLAEEVARAGGPVHLRVVANPRNLGYAGAMNKAFGLVTTPFVLTCHCDTLFGSDSYVATMLRHLEEHPEAGAVTGQPAVPAKARIPFAEKVNLVAYLMDIFPAEATSDLIPVGFAEGRCDAFRMEALRSAGFYDTRHHSAGEDQILSAKMRSAGYTVYQAPRMRYFLSVSDEQDTVGKLVRHMVLFGEKHPVLVLRSGAARGAIGGPAGWNRRRRSILRVNQLLSVPVYGLALFAVPAGVPGWGWGLPLVSIFLWKTWIFLPHMRVARFNPVQLAGFYLLQPALDLAYSLGVTRGLWYVFVSARGAPGSGAA